MSTFSFRVGIMSSLERYVWYQGSSDPEAASNFQDIQQWWTTLQGKEIIWQQRMLSGLDDLSSLDWSAQRFDERFFIKDPQVRGITFYWSKANQPDQSQNTTPQRLEFDAENQQLYVFPQSQQGLVLRITLPQMVYQNIALKNPQITVGMLDEYQVLTLKDDTKRIKVQVVLSPETLLDLKTKLL